MISRFFIDRPIFATVLSVVITLIGAVALAHLPIAQYPRVTPPAVVVSISYPGANAQVVADSQRQAIAKVTAMVAARRAEKETLAAAASQMIN